MRVLVTSPLPRLAVVGLCALAVLGATPAAGAAPSSDPTDPPAPSRNGLLLASLAADGSQPDAHSGFDGPVRAMSDDGRRVVFSTTAALVAADRNETDDVYLRDTVARTTTLVSATARGSAGNGASQQPTVSADGTRVAFVTEATDLLTVGRDRTPHALDVVLRDLPTGRTTLVSVDSRGRQGRGHSFAPSISGDGEHVAFQTTARLSRDDTDRADDVYVRDVAAGRTAKASYTPRGRDIRTPHLVGTVSDDGRVVVLADDTHVWARDVGARRTTLVWSESLETPEGGALGRPAVSGDGRYVAFHSGAVEPTSATSGYTVVYRQDLRTGERVRVSTGLDGARLDGDSFNPSLSRDGRFVAFVSEASTVVPDDPERLDYDVFVTDVTTGRTQLVTPGAERDAADDSGRSGASINADGDRVVLDSYDDTMVGDDANGWGDVYTWRQPA